jgi:hypothetical protein
MEFLGIILTKVSSVFCSILLADFIDKLYLKFKPKKSAKQENEKHFVERKDVGRKRDRKSSLRRLKFMFRNLD